MGSIALLFIMGVVAFVIGIIGFLQIQKSSTKNTLSTKAMVWIGILVVIWLIASYFFDSVPMIGFYLGYQIAFCLSFFLRKK